MYSYNTKRSTNARSGASQAGLYRTNTQSKVNHGPLLFDSDSKSVIKKKLLETDGYQIIPDRWSPSGWKFAYVDPLKH